MYYVELDTREDVATSYLCHRILLPEWQQVLQDSQTERNGSTRYQSCCGGIAYKGGGRLKGNTNIYMYM